MDKNLIQITDSDSGNVINAPFSLYFLKNGELFLVVGADFSQCRDRINFNSVSENIQCNQLGKLSEQGYISVDRIRFTLLNDGWDWQRYPDPEIVLIKDLSVKGKVVLSY